MDIGAEFLRPVLDQHGRVMLVVVDCLRLDQWEALRDLVTPLHDGDQVGLFPPVVGG